MLKGAVARRYAEAVFEIGVEQKTLDTWRADVATIATYFGNRQLAFVLGEPNIRFERKEAIVRDLLAAKVQPDPLKFALLLAERNLVGLAPRVSEEFDRLYDTYRGQAQAQVTTAMPLDDELRARIAADLQAMTGKRIILQERVDPSILGGVIARVGDTLIDGSVRRKLQLLREQIRQGGFGGPNDGLDGFTAPLVPDLGPAGGAPFVVAPGSESTGGGANGGSADGGKPSPSGPTSATEMAPRTGSAGGSAHMAPRPGGQPTGQRQGGQGANSSKRNNKGRRR